MFRPSVHQFDVLCSDLLRTPCLYWYACACPCLPSRQTLSNYNWSCVNHLAGLALAEVAIHGFALGSQYFFGRPLQELDLPDLALLAGIIKGPSYYNPMRNPKRAKERRNLVLKTMLPMSTHRRSTLISNQFPEIHWMKLSRMFLQIVLENHLDLEKEGKKN